MGKKYNIAFDLDQTITLNVSPRDWKSYGDCLPNPEMVHLMRSLKSAGHNIMIFTARGMGHVDGRPGKAMKDIGKMTFDWLEKHNIPYDEIFFGKPNYHVLIDDKCLHWDQDKMTIYDLIKDICAFFNKRANDVRYKDVDLLDPSSLLALDGDEDVGEVSHAAGSSSSQADGSDSE